MSSPTKPTPAAPTTGPSANPLNGPRFGAGEDREREREREGHDKLSVQHANHLPMPGLSGHANGPVGNLLKGTVDKDGNLKDASLAVGIKLDLEAEVHLTARVRGDILVGLY
ncbi:hypothetical protein VP1G_08973 [Cytospora mali]|uniref:Uncharacterized protein n=1 Tax=Cytospora mali TaxID=578113 RepID=A0A194VCV4_CYTMA|nr:hypothetical protein VP1G_08973 [Valsa mali var. pyri (nom. inval.)]